MKIRICVAGVTGWAGSAVARGALASETIELAAGVALDHVGEDLGLVLGSRPLGVAVAPGLAKALGTPWDVLVDFTTPGSVKARTLQALAAGKQVVVGTSGLSAADFSELEAAALAHGTGFIASGNFSITATLAKHFTLLAARYLPCSEILDYADAGKVDSPSGTVVELAEALGAIRPSELRIPLDQTHGFPATRGARLGGTQVHAVRLPGFILSFETIFGLPDERLTIRHDAGNGAEPYVAGVLLAVEKLPGLKGMVRGLDTLMFGDVKA
ncbi:MAG: 4-hydroxy-tetrahydrodipicolinate reductase [Holophaga sp.]|jgi:4-hydroxy-tetrahydrodipicolinate reductase